MTDCVFWNTYASMFPRANPPGRTYLLGVCAGDSRAEHDILPQSTARFPFPNASTDWDTAAALMAEIGADGWNGDTMAGISRACREASDKTGHVLAFEPELTPKSDEMLAYDNMSWVIESSRSRP